MKFRFKTTLLLLETVIRDNYKSFYGYEITNEEMKGMLQLRWKIQFESDIIN